MGERIERKEFLNFYPEERSKTGRGGRRRKGEEGE